MAEPLRCLCGYTSPDPYVDLTDLRGGRLDIEEHDCPYVPCDQAECRAKEHPQGEEELRAAVEHWRTHRYLHGCSHGR